jgi:integrase
LSTTTQKPVNRRPSAIIRSQRKADMGLPPEFPLFPHASGRWAKQIKSKRHYFGKIAEDPKGERAIRFWLDQKDAILAGDKVAAPAQTPPEAMTVGEICDRFRCAKEAMRDIGRLRPRTASDYGVVCDRIVAVFGADRAVASLASEDFNRLLVAISRQYGPAATAVEVSRVRAVFNHALKAEWIDRPVKGMGHFVRPPKSEIDAAREGKGERMFQPDELRTLLDAAGVHFRAMIYLGINSGFGNSDCGHLPLSRVKPGGPIMEFPRPKNKVRRKSWLWPETREALVASLAERPEPASEDVAGLFFLTTSGRRWFTDDTQSPIASRFHSLLVSSGVYRPGLNFYALRHSFRTVADDVGDERAVDWAMGHARAKISERYVETPPSDSRCAEVSNFVRKWLFPEASESDS